MQIHTHTRLIQKNKKVYLVQNKNNTKKVAILNIFKYQKSDVEFTKSAYTFRGAN